MLFNSGTEFDIIVNYDSYQSYIPKSGDALGPTATGFVPPAEWKNDPLFNLKTISGLGCLTIEPFSGGPIDTHVQHFYQLKMTVI